MRFHRLSILAAFISLSIISWGQVFETALIVSDKYKAELFGNVKSCSTTIYEATRTGDLVKKSRLVMSATVDYDQNGFGTRMIMPNANTTYKNTYGTNGQLESVKTYVNGAYDGVSRYVYEPGRVVETMLDNAGAKAGTVIHSKGKSVADDGETTMTIFYNANNLMTKTVSDTKTQYGNYSITTVPTYNSHSVIERLTLSTLEGSGVIKYSDYKYDEQGNWVYRVKSQDGYGVRVEERVIEYYE